MEILSKIKGNQTGLSEIVRDIVKKTDPEKILLISASYDYRFTENIFDQNPSEELKSSHYSLLILGKAHNSAFSVKFMHSYISQFSNPSDLHLFFMDIYDFNTKLDNGDEYAAEIASNAMIWYDKGEIAIHAPILKHQ